MTLDQMRQMYADGDFDDDEEDDDEDDEDDDDDDEDAAVPVFVGDPSGGAQFGEDESDEVDDDDQDEDEETSDYDSEDEAAGRSKSEVRVAAWTSTASLDWLRVTPVYRPTMPMS